MTTQQSHQLANLTGAGFTPARMRDLARPHFKLTNWKRGLLPAGSDPFPQARGPDLKVDDAQVEAHGLKPGSRNLGPNEWSGLEWRPRAIVSYGLTGSQITTVEAQTFNRAL